jgi:hypothetical protein
MISFLNRQDAQTAKSKTMSNSLDTFLHQWHVEIKQQTGLQVKQCKICYYLSLMQRYNLLNNHQLLYKIHSEAAIQTHAFIMNR